MDNFLQVQNQQRTESLPHQHFQWDTHALQRTLSGKASAAKLHRITQEDPQGQTVVRKTLSLNREEVPHSRLGVQNSREAQQRLPKKTNRTRKITD